MNLKKKQDHLTPWETNQETMLSVIVIHEAIQPKDQVEHKQAQIDPLKSSIIQEKKRYHTIESLISMKSKKQTRSDFTKIQKRRVEKPLMRQVKSINQNLMNIINTYQMADQNSEKPNKKLGIKKSLKDPLKQQRLQRNYSSETAANNKANSNLDLIKLKKQLFEKRNPPLLSLVKVREKLHQINEPREHTILRTYSVHNMRMNVRQQKSDVQNLRGSTKQKDSSDSILSLSPLKNAKLNKIEQLRPRLKSCVNLEPKQHVIDRLFDKFY